jgi:hypothetical protein
MQLGKQNHKRLENVRSHCQTIIWLTELAEEAERNQDNLTSCLDDALSRMDTIADLLEYVKNYPEEGKRRYTSTARLMTIVRQREKNRKPGR